MKTCSICGFEKNENEFYRRQCKKCRNKNASEWNKKNINSIRINSRRCMLKKFGLTLSDIETIEIKQNSCCAICKKSFSKTPHVDHIHGTKEVRGLLCHKCNVGIGYMDEDLFIIQNAAKYLIKHGTKHDKANHK